MSSGAWKVKRSEIRRAGDALHDLGLQVDSLEIKPDGTVALKSRSVTDKPEMIRAEENNNNDGR
jgi:hypothetical protein